MRFAYVLPDPASYADWAEFDGDLDCMKRAGYDVVELQIADPAEFDEQRVRRSLQAVGFTMCAFQTGATYATRGNCLCTADDAVRQRTIALLESHVELAARWHAVVVFGSLQGRHSDEPDHAAGQTRIEAAIAYLGKRAGARGVTVALEPVNQLEVGFNNTIAAVAGIVRRLNLPGLRMMVDTFHMNIEEKEMLAPLAGIADILAHVHLSDTNRDLLGAGHWSTAGFLGELQRLGYDGVCSVGVYHTARPRRECITRCMDAVCAAPGPDPRR
jgi:sugar phosphate isomerase/epimerase